MSRRAKGPRLWWRADRAAWFILDGPRQRGTGLGVGASNKEKEDALAAYLAEKHTKRITTGKRDPSVIPIEDVLTLYVRDVVMPKERSSPARKAPKHALATLSRDDLAEALKHNSIVTWIEGGHARPHETASRIEFLRKFWRGRVLSEVIGATCREYTSQRSTDAAARRELEDLRAAIIHHRKEGLHDRIISVTLPERSPPRERWLTKEEAASLIRAAWRYREKQNFRATERATRKHVARFMVVARYMGSRAAVICGASIEDKRPAGKPWVDLRTGVFYGRAAGERETKKRKQVVRVPPPLLAHMRRWRKNGQRYVVQWNGKPVTRVDKAHRAAVADAELGPDVTPHVWRHSVATWLMEAGLKPSEVADWLAMSESTLMRVYRHLPPASFTAVHEAL